MSPGLLDSDSPSLSLVSVNISQLTLSGCGSKKSDLDLFGDHVSTCTDHSGVKRQRDGEGRVLIIVLMIA